MREMISSCMFYSICLLFIIVHIRASKNDCSQLSSCGHHVYKIEFPFRLRDRHSGKCGYPGFDLSFTLKNETVLHILNTQIKLYVVDINYDVQRIVVAIPDYSRSSEARRGLEFLDLSKTPFRFDSGFSSFSMMNCSNQNGNLRPMFSSDLVEYDFIGCTKMYTYNKSIELDSVYHNYYDHYGIYSAYFSIKWSIPSCEPCKQQFKRCRLKKNTLNHETECYDRYEKISKGPFKSIVTAASIVGSFVVLFMVIATLYLYTLDKKEKENRRRIEKFLEDYIALKPSRYTYADIKKITYQFKIKIGQGAYGTVFKGKLSNDIFVAVKILSNITKGDSGDFVNEVSTMGRIHHVNVARLVGYCADGYRRALVYEFFPNHSLDKYISKTQLSLSWERLRAISIGIAKGIDYLHQGCDQRILHFDIKPHNILLDQNFTPKICDFGLAKLCSKDQSIVSMTATRGTMGYIAPEVFSRNFGNVSCKSDVYSFGMLLLEMVGGRKNTRESTAATEEIYYPEWIYNLLEEGEDLRIQIEEEGDAIIATRLAIVGLWCIQWHPIGRPSMKAVVQMLVGTDDLTMPPNPFVSTSSNSAMSNSIVPLRRVAFELEPITE